MPNAMGFVPYRRRPLPPGWAMKVSELTTTREVQYEYASSTILFFKLFKMTPPGCSLNPNSKNSETWLIPPGTVLWRPRSPTKVLFDCLFDCLFVYLFDCLFGWLVDCLFVCVPVCLAGCLFGLFDDYLLD